MDFKDWCLVVDLYYFGYHLTSEGKILIKDIKTQPLLQASLAWAGVE
jgi:hypothetical protein